MTIKEFRELTKEIPDETVLVIYDDENYEAYDIGAVDSDEQAKVINTYEGKHTDADKFAIALLT